MCSDDRFLDSVNLCLLSQNNYWKLPFQFHKIRGYPHLASIPFRRLRFSKREETTVPTEVTTKVEALRLKGKVALEKLHLLMSWLREDEDNGDAVVSASRCVFIQVYKVHRSTAWCGTWCNQKCGSCGLMRLLVVQNDTVSHNKRFK